MDHSQMDHSQMDHSQMDHSQMDHSQMDHSQMDHSQMDHSQMDHSQMDHSQMDHSQRDHGGRALPRTPIPVLTDADRAAAVAPAHPHAMHDDGVNRYVLLDRLEAWDAAPGTGLAWEAQGWIGTDLDRLWVRSMGERTGGRLASADVELLYGRSVSRWWDVVAGLRHDTAPGPAQDWLALGVMGLAPYRFEVQATVYLGKAGQAEARLEAEYDVLLTNRLILQPAVELSLQARDDARRGVASGISTAEAGLRLRYEFKRRFAPYVGIVHERSFGRTAELREVAGERARQTRWVAGVRVWF
ncbi:copper resistance protein B, partial [Pseudoxanthomonas composti]